MASPPVIDNHPIFTTAAYSAASVAALWGIIEIFLRIDPFFLVYLKHAFSLGIGLMAMAVAGLIYTYISTFIPKTQAKKNNENCKKNPSRGTLYFFFHPSTYFFTSSNNIRPSICFKRFSSSKLSFTMDFVFHSHAVTFSSSHILLTCTLPERDRQRIFEQEPALD
ncbi:hypothetical protein [Halomonas sp. DN3]|uniref:hypothetical protein n=1 Tax=Halomonas sp. DN3 TaxID=2953657 RepID=UPI0020A1DEA3|nr:hypothetical protein [Halomonas sp. DN3]USZ48991.1 hypothetical protein NKF27_16005 [Halomonas sp. DN3]